MSTLFMIALCIIVAIGGYGKIKDNKGRIVLSYILFIGLIFISSFVLYEDMKQEADYNRFPDMFCQEYDMNYKMIKSWSNTEHFCIKASNDDTMNTRQIDTDGRVWAWTTNDALDMEDLE